MEQLTYKIAEDPNGTNNERKLFDSKGHSYSIQNKSNLDGSSIWVCQKLVGMKYCTGKVKLTDDRQLTLLRDHNHLPDPVLSIFEESYYYKNKSDDPSKYVLKHNVTKGTLYLYDSIGHEYALKYQDAIGNSRWRCPYTANEERCPGQVCIIIKDDHKLDTLTDHFHAPYIKPNKFAELYNPVKEVYDTLSPITDCYDKDIDVVSKFCENQNTSGCEATENINRPIKPITSPDKVPPKIEPKEQIFFKYIQLQNFPNPKTLCDSSGHAYDLIGKLGSKYDVYCCHEIFFNECEAELLQNKNNEFTICSQHNHPPKRNIVQYILDNNIFGDHGKKRRQSKGSFRTSKKTRKHLSSDEDY